MMESFQFQQRLATLPNIEPSVSWLHQVASRLGSSLGRWWSAQCRHAERVNRVVPRY